MGLTPRKEAIARKKAWQLALKEGRVLRATDGTRHVAFPTTKARDEYLAKLEPGMYEIVRVEPEPG